MISKETAQHIADLARLSFSEQELEKFRKEFSAILDYVSQLKELDVSNLKPLSTSIFCENVFREDKPKKEDPSKANQLVEAAPSRKERYVQVKQIL